MKELNPSYIKMNHETWTNFPQDYGNLVFKSHVDIIFNFQFYFKSCKSITINDSLLFLNKFNNAYNNTHIFLASKLVNKYNINFDGSLILYDEIGFKKI